MVCIAVEFNSNIRYFEMRPKQTWYSAGIKFNSNIRYFEMVIPGPPPGMAGRLIVI